MPRPCWSYASELSMRDSRVHNYPPRWNGAPSQELLVVRRNHDTGKVSLDPLRWGLAMKDGKPFGIGGLSENWRDFRYGEWVRTFAIVTTDANELVASFCAHHELRSPTHMFLGRSQHARSSRTA